MILHVCAILSEKLPCLTKISVDMAGLETIQVGGVRYDVVPMAVTCWWSRGELMC